MTAIFWLRTMPSSYRAFGVTFSFPGIASRALNYRRLRKPIKMGDEGLPHELANTFTSAVFYPSPAGAQAVASSV